ncbi:hypothetical protein B0I33_102508 [Prauserella shujinwangii]|uniref:Uncharacterized protein n=1 Tax=Prauserella shujinwangii TaxID=1453103 RepID=A0A2T0M1E1_9PSEU|nr:hypothetical protein [Prauserella shujinwangii]PRX50387.1 hypothetical protein B0I33_102508 [Prauserella shujinwangii]
MSGLILYARSRRLATTVGAIVAAVVLGATIGPAQHQLNTASESSIPWLMLLPLVLAAAIGLSIRSSMHDLDATSARALACWRLGQIVALAVLSAAGLVLITADLTGPFGSTAALRNLAGFLGVTLLTGRLIAGRLAWLLPSAWAFTALTLGDPAHTGLPWDWPVRHGDDVPAALTALALAALGLLAGATGTREPRDEHRS